MERQTHTIDATDKSLGRIATKIAVLLRGKEKPGFVPYLDNGDFVVVENLKPETDHRFIFIVLREHLKKYALNDLFNQVSPGCVLLPLVS